jgi:hypothetical protein
VTELDDDALYRAFTAAALTPAQFRHREHVRGAFVCLARAGDLALAACEFRRSLRRLVIAMSAEHRYHETLTWAYLTVIHELIATADPPFATSDQLLAAHPELLDHGNGAIASYYDIAAITASPRARRHFVLPGRVAR